MNAKAAAALRMCQELNARKPPKPPKPADPGGIGNRRAKPYQPDGLILK